VALHSAFIAFIANVTECFVMYLLWNEFLVDNMQQYDSWQ